MCGITGFIDFAKASSEEHLRSLAAAMANTLTHRGPDGGDAWADAGAGVALGHRRLSIQDLSPAGRQPMHSADGRYVIVFNGEIYNFRDLQQELAALGHGFRGHSDTEVLLAAIVQWGLPQTLPRLLGMFAFGLWDRQEQTLFLARDRAGKKPLYYGRCGNSFLFGSELKALRRHPGFEDEIDRDALAGFLQHSWVPGPRSIYRAIRKLPAGCSLALGAGGEPLIQAYWDAAEVARSGEREPFQGSMTDAADELERLLLDATERRMISDVPLGALLSGGFDSTTVVSLMQRLSDRPVKTFTIGFDEADYDESVHARAIVEHLGTDHTELTVTHDDALEVIPQLPEMYDEPFADASQIPTYIVSRLARSRVTVALSGDGGDELFAGYKRYRRALRDARRWSGMPGGLQLGVARLLRAGERLGWRVLQPPPGADSMPGWRRFAAGLDRNAATLTTSDPVRLFARLRARTDSGAALVPGAHDIDYPLGDVAAAANLAEPMQGMMLYDFTSYLVDDILVKVDRASMAVSLEVRSPFLDHRVVEFAWRLPLALRWGERGSKLVVRELLKRYVPPALTERPKAGFGVPVGEWLRGPLRDWAESLIDPGRIRSQGLLDEPGVTTLWRQHLCGWRDHSDVLWSVLMFQAWLDNESATGNTAG